MLKLPIRYCCCLVMYICMSVCHRIYFYLDSHVFLDMADNVYITEHICGLTYENRRFLILIFYRKRCKLRGYIINSKSSYNTITILPTT